MGSLSVKPRICAIFVAYRETCGGVGFSHFITDFPLEVRKRMCVGVLTRPFDVGRVNFILIKRISLGTLVSAEFRWTVPPTWLVYGMILFGLLSSFQQLHNVRAVFGVASHLAARICNCVPK